MSTLSMFKKYLLATLPEEYPIASIPLSMKMRSAHKKELIFQQTKFLDMAEGLIGTSPWVTYVASKKYLLLIERLKIDSGTYSEIAEKEYFHQSISRCENVLSNSRAMLADDIKQYCDRLVALQMCGFRTKNELKPVLVSLLNHGIKFIEPPMAKPKHGPWGCITVIPGIICAIPVFAISQSPYLVLTAFIVPSVVTCCIIWGRYKIDRDKNDLYEVFQELSGKYNKIPDAYFNQLGLKRVDLARDVKYALDIANYIMKERAELENNYIHPYSE